MVTFILAAAALICAFEWLNQKAVNYALLKWISDRFDCIPGEELRDDLIWVWNHMLGIN